MRQPFSGAIAALLVACLHPSAGVFAQEALKFEPGRKGLAAVSDPAAPPRAIVTLSRRMALIEGGVPAPLH